MSDEQHYLSGESLPYLLAKRMAELKGWKSGSDEIAASEDQYRKSIEEGINNGKIVPLAHDTLSPAARNAQIGVLIFRYDEVRAWARTSGLDWPDDWLKPVGYVTIRDACEQLAINYKLPKGDLEKRLMEPVNSGDIQVYSPLTRLPYTPTPPKPFRDFYDLVKIDALNAWFAKADVPYLLQTEPIDDGMARKSRPGRKSTIKKLRPIVERAAENLYKTLDPKKFTAPKVAVHLDFITEVFGKGQYVDPRTVRDRKKYRDHYGVGLREIQDSIRKVRKRILKTSAGNTGD